MKAAEALYRGTLPCFHLNETEASTDGGRRLRGRGAILMLCMVAASFAAAKDVEIRSRIDIVDGTGGTHYEVTEVIRLGDVEESHTFLVRDSSTGDRYILGRLVDYQEGQASYSISDPKGEAFVRTSFAIPRISRNREDYLREARQNPALLSIPTILSLETNAGTWSDIHTAWDDWSPLRDLRHQVRPLMNASLLEGIERMRDSVFAQPSASPFAGGVSRAVGGRERPERRL